MSKTDTERQGDTNVDVPVVLTLACKTAQGYLNSQNEILRSLYGKSPIRMDVVTTGFPWKLFVPEDQDSRLVLLERFTSVSVSQLSSFVRSSEFIDALKQEICNGAQPEEGVEPPVDWHEKVRLVIANEGYVADGLPLPEVIRKHFPHAELFTVDFHERSIPKHVALDR